MYLSGELVYKILFEEASFESRKEKVLHVLLKRHLFEVESNFQSVKHVQIKLFADDPRHLIISLVILIKQEGFFIVEDLLYNSMSDFLIFPEAHHLHGFIQELLYLLNKVKFIIYPVYVLFALPIHFHNIKV